MSKVDDGGPAYPVPEQRDENGCCILQAHDGMSLRDWFAGQALAGMIESHGMGEKRHEYAAHDAYRFADAMLAARQGQGGSHEQG